VAPLLGSAEPVSVLNLSALSRKPHLRFTCFPCGAADKGAEAGAWVLLAASVRRFATAPLCWPRPLRPGPTAGPDSTGASASANLSEAQPHQPGLPVPRPIDRTGKDNFTPSMTPRPRITFYYDV